MLGISNVPNRSRVEQFDLENSKDAPAICDGSWVRFSTGAVRENSPNCVMQAALEDQWSPGLLASRILRYHELSVTMARDEFEKEKLRFMRESRAKQNERFVSAPSTIPTVAIKKIKALKLAVISRQENLVEVRAKIAKGPEVVPGSREDIQRIDDGVRRRASDLNHAENAKIVDGIENITI